MEVAPCPLYSNAMSLGSIRLIQIQKTQMHKSVKGNLQRYVKNDMSN